MLSCAESKHQEGGGLDLALLFDIDGTLTPPRKSLQREMATALMHLKAPFHVAAGSDLPLVYPQFLQPLGAFGFRGEFHAFLSNGAAHYRCSYSQELSLIKLEEQSFPRCLGIDNYQYLLRTIIDVLDSDRYRLPASLRIIGQRLINRKSMLNVSPIGRPRGTLSDDARRNREVFKEFDRKTRYRLQMLTTFRERLSRLQSDKKLMVLLGGETSFDFLISGMDKTNAVRKLLAKGIKKLVFLGDALYEGGNDSVISDFIANWTDARDCPLEAIQVQNWKETLAVLRSRGWIPTRRITQ